MCLLKGNHSTGFYERGVAIAELALLLPVILLVTAGVLNFWMLFTNYFHLYGSVLKGVGQQICRASTDEDIQREANYLVFSTMRSVNSSSTAVEDDAMAGFKKITVTVGVSLPVPIPAFGSAVLVGEIVGYDP